MTTKTTISALTIATLKGGDPNGLKGQDTIWTDLEPCDGPDVWRVLVASTAAAEAAAENTGAELLSVEEWDGSRFGDGAIGCVSSPRPGTIVCGSPEFLSGLPEGWTTSRE
jgi:hypothetical protein